MSHDENGFPACEKAVGKKVVGKKSRKFGREKTLSPGKIRAYLEFLDEEGSCDSGPLSDDIDSDESDSDYEVVEMNTSLGETLIIDESVSKSTPVRSPTCSATIPPPSALPSASSPHPPSFTPILHPPSSFPILQPSTSVLTPGSSGISLRKSQHSYPFLCPYP